jgi:hypothetical protein
MKVCQSTTDLPSTTAASRCRSREGLPATGTTRPGEHGGQPRLSLLRGTGAGAGRSDERPELPDREMLALKLVEPDVLEGGGQ